MLIVVQKKNLTSKPEEGILISRTLAHLWLLTLVLRGLADGELASQNANLNLRFELLCRGKGRLHCQPITHIPSGSFGRPDDSDDLSSFETIISGNGISKLNPR